jgi:SAM-dependent methyltransferase
MSVLPNRKAMLCSEIRGKANDCARMRMASFRKPVAYNEKLRDMVKDESSHFFLANPASQNTYLYQVEFVHAFSEHYFGKPLSELKVLDWGCGKGHVSFLLRERGARVVSCDHYAEGGTDDDSAFGQGTPIIRRAGIRVDRLSDPVKLPYADCRFDVALSFGVLEHVQRDLESLKELRRVLRPGGLLFCFNLPYLVSWTQQLSHLRGNYYHDRLYTKTQTAGLLKEAGYVVLDLWHRQLFPKNSVRYPFYRAFESLDQILVRYTPMRYLATNIEFVAVGQDLPELCGGAGEGGHGRSESAADG